MQSENEAVSQRLHELEETICEHGKRIWTTEMKSVENQQAYSYIKDAITEIKKSIKDLQLSDSSQAAQRNKQLFGWIVWGVGIIAAILLKGKI